MATVLPSSAACRAAAKAVEPLPRITRSKRSGVDIEMISFCVPTDEAEVERAHRRKSQRSHPFVLNARGSARSGLDPPVPRLERPRFSRRGMTSAHGAKSTSRLTGTSPCLAPGVQRKDERELEALRECLANNST